jgi:putative ABC transport system ATP-binding protein/lipoprotein-releasing system ATP-binding protein
VIEVRELNKTYEIDGQTFKAVDNVSFLIGKGEMVSIMGHSGSGKTTLLSLIGGLTKPASGSVLIEDRAIWSMSDDELSGFRNRKMNFIYQFSSLVPTLTALENVMLPTAFGDYGEDVEGYARELLALVGLKEKENSYPSHLSGGQQRRVAIARAFINKPDIILADEPTGDLDEETEAEIIGLFNRMNKEAGTTFVIVTHNKEIAARAGRQLKMANGIVSEINKA